MLIEGPARDVLGGTLYFGRLLLHFHFEASL